MRHVWPLLKKPGQYIDPGFANFGVRVSPKLKSVWVIRRSSGTGAARKEVTETLGLVQFPDSIPDGSNILDLLQAQAAAREWLAEQKDPVYAAKKRAERVAAGLKPLTLGEAFAEYKVERRTKRGGPLADQTIISYDKTFSTYLSASADLPLLTTGVNVGGVLKLSQIGRFEFVDGLAMMAPAMTSARGGEPIGIAVREIRPRPGPLSGSSCPR